MKKWNWLLITVLVGAVTWLDVAAFVRPREPNDDSREATFARGALQQQLLMMRDARGSIAADGFMHAKAQADRLRAHHRNRALASGATADPGGTETITTTSLPTPTGPTAPWRWLGPATSGGRLRTIAISPSDPNLIFIGSAGGGIWRSTDGGSTWTVCDDFMPALSVSSIVFDPHNPNVVYAGTGEGFGNADEIAGAGIFKSTDGGVTWPQLPATALSVSSHFHYVDRLAFSSDGSVLLAATADGVYRSTDGGASFVNTAPAGAYLQVVFSPSDPTAAVAAQDGVVIHTRDGGQTWTVATGLAGIPTTSRIEVAYSKADGSIYASVDYDGGQLYRSFDGGASFNPIASNIASFLGDQGWYDDTIWVNPVDANDIVVGGMNLYQSQDGGVTLTSMQLYPLHVDHHVIVEDPGFNDAADSTVYVGNDGGLFRTTDLRHTIAGSTGTWAGLNNGLGITQFYGADASLASGTLIGGTQDTATQRFSGGSWFSGFSGDTGTVAADQFDSNLFYLDIQYAAPYRSSDGGETWQSIGSGISDGENTNFIAPVVLDPNDRHRLYIGKGALWRTDDVLASTPVFFSAAPLVPAGSTNYISAIAVQPADSDVVWLGRDDGDVYRTTNGTSTTPSWTKVNTFGSAVSSIRIDPADSNSVFVTRGGFQPNNVWHSTDGGSTWTAAAGSGETALPEAPVYDLQIDPANRLTLFAATEVGVFESLDGGATWDTSEGLGPANTRVTQLFWMGGSLIAATHGRGVWALDVNASTGAPAMAASPSSLTFGTQATGTSSAPQTVTIGNTGGAAMAIQSVWISGNDPADFTLPSDNCSGTSVAAGGSCAVQVLFSPTASGTRSGTLWIADTAPGSPHSVPLTGTGGTTGTLPGGWTDADVGAVGVAGGALATGGIFTVQGSGADVWGTADAFNYVYLPLAGDGTIVARVATVTNGTTWVKAGVMIRGSLSPSSAQAFMLVSSAKGVAFQRRTSDGSTSVSTTGSSATAPHWVQLARAGNVITASESADGTTWTVVGSDTFTMPTTAYVGLVLSSHNNAQLATATFDNVSTTAASSSASGLPPGWTDTDIGVTDAAGLASYAGGTFSVSGAGADVWGSADALNYTYLPLSGDGWMIARVATVSNQANWVKAGVMIRTSLSPSAAQAFMLVSAAKGVAFQRRLADGTTSVSTAGSTASAPRWVKITRTGSTISGYESADGTTWTLVGTDTFTMGASAFIGLGVSSHLDGTLATATFDNVTSSTAPSTGLPAGWSQSDIGSVPLAGSGSYSSNTFSVTGSGTDIWGTADAFHYVYSTLSGDGSIVARVASVQPGVSSWVKAGVMIRETLDAGSTQVIVLVSAAKGVAFQRRETTNGASLNTAGSSATAPHWLKLTRSGNTFSAYESPDGTTWTLVGTDTISMATTAYVGLAVTSHSTSSAATCTFDNVSIE